MGRDAVVAGSRESRVVARRAGDVWYVGGISGQEAPQDTRVEMGFLGSGSWKMTLIRDGVE